MEGGVLKFWSCREVSRMIAEGRFDEASGFSWLLARLHLLGCRFCRRYLLQMRLLSRAAKAWAGALLQAPDRTAFEKRLIERLSGSL